MAQTENKSARLPILFFEGVNTLVSNQIAKVEEPVYAENYRSSIMGIIEKRHGFKQIWNDKNEMKNLALFYWPYLSTPTTSYDNDGLFRILKWNNGWTPNINIFYYTNTSQTWEILWAHAFSTDNEFKTCIVDKDIFLVNGADTNVYISPGGTLTLASLTTGNLYNSPQKAYDIEFFKDRIYMMYPVLSGTTEIISSMIQFSSLPMGIIALSAENKDSIWASTWDLKVEGDTKYFIAWETIEIWRSWVQVGTAVVNSIKSNDLIAVTFTSLGWTPAYIQAGDELWISGTHDGATKYRWSAQKSGADVQKYDTFKFAGNDNSRGTMMVNVGNLLMLANKTTLGVWNGSDLKKFDIKIGCISPKGYIKVNGLLYFMDYSGVYVTDGTSLPKLISSKVEWYIKDMSPAVLETATITTKWLSIFVAFRAIGNDKINIYDNARNLIKTLDYLVLEYDTRQENWYTHTWSTLSLYEVLTANVLNQKDTYIFASGIDHKTYEFLPPEELYTDDGKDISFVVETNNIGLQPEMENLSQIERIAADIVSWSDISLSFSGDGKQMEPLAQLYKWDNLVQVKSWVQGDILTCKKIKLKISEISNRPVRMSQLQILYKPSTQEVVNDNNK